MGPTISSSAAVVLRTLTRRPGGSPTVTSNHCSSRSRPRRTPLISAKTASRPPAEASRAQTLPPRGRTPSARPALRKQPSDQCGRSVGCVPDIVIRPWYLEVLHGCAGGLEGRRRLTRLLHRNDLIDLPVDDPGWDAPELTSQRVVGRAAIGRNDRREQARRSREGC